METLNVSHQIMHMSTAMVLLQLGSFLEYTRHIDRIVLFTTWLSACVFAWASIELQINNPFKEGEFSQIVPI